MGVRPSRLNPATLLELVQHLGDVDRQPDRAALLGDGSRNPLTNPPIGVGGELVTTGGIKLLDAAHQTDGAFLDQVQSSMFRLVYFLATLTTSRRLAATIRSLARRPC